MRLRFILVIFVLCGLGTGLAFFALPGLVGDDRADTEQPTLDSAIPGRWRQRRNVDETEPNDADPARKMEQLRSLGYVSSSRTTAVDAPRTGLVFCDPDLSQPGLNVVISAHRPEVALYDQDGTMLHRWTADFFSIWPDTDPSTTTNGTSFFRNTHLLPGGEILAIFEWEGLVKLGADSEVLWARPNHAHHDLAVHENGDIVVLTYKDHLIPRISREDPIREDFLTRLDSEGNFLCEVSLLECLEQSVYRNIHDQRDRRVGDIYHTNTVHLLDGSLADRLPAFSAGNILTSFRYLDTIAVVDMERAEVVWAATDYFHGQHDPQILPTGNLLLFDNNSQPDRNDLGHSRVVEYEPASMTPVWSYGGPDTEFYSQTCGAAQRLPNGNTLITESDNGRAIEVTPEGQIVWEFINPHRAGEQDRFVATLFRVFRLPPDYDLAWLERLGQGS